MGDPQDKPSRTALLERARELEIDGRTTMDDDKLVAAIAEAEKARGVVNVSEAVQTTTADQAPIGNVAGQLSADAGGVPTSPDQPTDGRPPLADIASGRASGTYVRVIGAEKE